MNTIMHIIINAIHIIHSSSSSSYYYYYYYYYHIGRRPPRREDIERMKRVRQHKGPRRRDRDPDLPNP